MTARQHWNTIIETHQERYTANHNRRLPMTVMADKETLNLIVTGRKEAGYLTFDKCVLHTSFGDLYFHEHRDLGGEVVLL